MHGALTMAVLKNRIKCVRILLIRGAPVKDLYYSNKDLYTPLRAAVLKGNVLCLREGQSIDFSI